VGFGTEWLLIFFFFFLFGNQPPLSHSIPWQKLCWTNWGRTE